MCLDQPYDQPTTTTDFAPCSQDPDTWVLVGARISADEPELLLMAVAKARDVFATTALVGGQPAAAGGNGTFWYNVPSTSFGFAESPAVLLQPGDTTCWDFSASAWEPSCDCAARLSWPLDGSGGFRAGCALWPNDPAVRKVVYLLTGLQPPPCPPGSSCPGSVPAPAPCPAGSFCSGPVVAPCPPGSFCPAGSSTPTACPPGSFAAAAGSSPCPPTFPFPSPSSVLLRAKQSESTGL